MTAEIKLYRQIPQEVTEKKRGELSAFRKGARIFSTALLLLAAGGSTTKPSETKSGTIGSAPSSKPANFLQIEEGSDVRIIYKNTSIQNCRVGSEQGLYYPPELSPMPAVNTENCSDPVQMEGVASILIRGKKVTCDVPFVPSRPKNCKP